MPNGEDVTVIKERMINNCGVSSGVYGLAFLGAAFYYIQNDPTLAGIVFGILKAIIWPAMLVYKLLEFFKM